MTVLRLAGVALSLVLLTSACSGTVEFGVALEDGDVVILSSCSGRGVHRVRVGPPDAPLETIFDAAAEGIDPPVSYRIGAVDALPERFTISADFGDGLYGEDLDIEPAALTEDTVVVSHYPKPGTLSRGEFDQVISDCDPNRFFRFLAWFVLGSAIVVVVILAVLLRRWRPWESSGARGESDRPPSPGT